MSVVDLYHAAHETELNEKIETLHKTKSYDYHIKRIKAKMKEKNDK